MRRPMRAGDALDHLDQVRVVAEACSVSSSRPLLLDVDQVGPIDQDVGHFRIAE
jgi:hypothetical protein